LAKTTLLRPHVPDRHALQGIWLDRAGNVYVADSAHGEVKRVTPQGSVSVVAKSTLPWSPCGGAFAPNGELLLLEYSITNDVRLRRVRLK
jgi:sugar lactone lactonase YvrE